MSGSAVVRSVLVVGGGLGGFHVTHALRRRGFDGQITVLCAEERPPYDRPPLSKAYLAGTISAEDLALDNSEAPLDVTWKHGVAAALVTGDSGRAIHTAEGEELSADVIVLATGADAIRLGPVVPGSHVIRTLDDAERLRTDGMKGRRVIVVGTGFIGLEAAAVAASMEAESVTIVAPEQGPLAERYGTVVGAAVQSLHERHGVRFRNKEMVTELLLDETGRASGVRLSGGEAVEADLVISGIGVRPATGWLTTAEGLTLAPNGAVVCSARGTTGLAGVWAIGDCAQWAHADARMGLRRVGHWQDAIDHAGVVAAEILGEEPPALPDPYCWSDQYDVMLQVAGHLYGDETAVVRAGSIEDADLLVTFERDGAETAVLGMNRQRDVMRWRRTRTPARKRTVPA